LYPQHFIAPALVMAQVCDAPAAIATTPLVSPCTSTGTALETSVLLPSSPAPLFPQHLTPPAAVSAHEW
jgi:hypothetical protein